MKIRSILFVFITLFLGCQNTTISNKFEIFTCGAEIIQNDKILGSDGISYCGSKNLRSKQDSRTGRYSILLDSTHKYGFDKNINGLKKGEFVTASIWGKSQSAAGMFVCVVENGDSTRIIRQSQANPKPNQWCRYNIEVYVADDNTTLKFYAFTGKEAVYFDDLSIKRFKTVPLPNVNLGKKGYALSLNIPKTSLELLEKYKEKSLKDGVISKESKKYVGAFLLRERDSIPIKIRLKGDWIDHLNSGKISYRIKMVGRKTFLGLSAFSIQHPKTRNFMHEWLMHKLFDKEGLLSTMYEFISVEINGVNKGVFAIEEHFKKQLLEKRERVVGPILRFDETGLWQLTLAIKKSLNKNIKLPVFEASKISAFDKRKEASYLANVNFDEGAILVNKYKNFYSALDKIFDIEKLAKYYALLEIGSIDHVHQWQNMRFYFNPIAQNLEMIGFDMNPGHNVYDNSFIYKKLIGEKGPKEWHLIDPALSNKEFKQLYLKYLIKYTDSTYLYERFKQLANSIELNENLLSLEIDHYGFDKEFYLLRCQKIRQDIPSLDSIWTEYINDFKFEDSKNHWNHYVHSNAYFLSQISVNAYVEKLASERFQMTFINYHLNPIKIIGYCSKDKDTVFFETPIDLAGFTCDHRKNESIKYTKIHPHKFLFKTKENPSIIRKKKALNWPRPIKESTRIKLENDFKTSAPFYQIKDSILVFNQGKLTIDKLIYIPKNYKVVILEGTEIDLVDGGGLIINNSLEFNGSVDNRILVHSSDTNNNGITILNSSSVTINYVDFSDLKALNYNHWILSGAITIYESVVKLNSVTIKNIFSGSACKIVRSNIFLNNLKILNVKSNVLDLTFCRGKVLNSFYIDDKNAATNLSFQLKNGS